MAAGLLLLAAAVDLRSRHGRVHPSGVENDSATATAYSLGQQLVTTAFNVVFAIVLICMVFGWSGGSKLVKDSYTDAKEKASEMKASRGKGLDALEAEGDAQAADADS